MSKLATKISAVSLSIVTMVSLAGPASAQSTADLQAQIAALLAQINALQAQLAGQQGGASTSYSFTRNLTVGSKGDDVSALQRVLIAGGYLKISAPTGYFGAMTKAALAAWQKDHNVSPAVGYFGPLTRSAMASVGGGGTTPGSGPVVVVPAGSDLVVSLAADSPAAKTLGSGTAFNPALKFNLTAGAKKVTVSAIKVMKNGFMLNTNLNGVEIVDAMGVRYGNVVTSINADNSILITFGSSPVVVDAGKSVALMVRFNLLAGAYTGTISFGLDSVSAITADTTAISGAFPVNGAIFNVVDGSSSLATVTLDVQNLSTAALNVDEASQQEITKFSLAETSSKDQIKIYKFVLYNYGSSGDADFKDVQLVAQDGTVLATAQPASKWITFDLSAAPYLIDKGLTKYFTIKAKIVNGTSRTIQLVVYNNYDVDLRGVSSGVSVIPAAGTTDTSFPIGNSNNSHSINSGTLTMNRDASSPSSAVTPGAQNVVLAKYYAKPIGEQVELRQVAFGVLQTGTALTGTVYVKVNDQIVYSTAASTFAAAGTVVNPVTLSSYPVLASGVNSYITVETSIPSSATSSNSYTVKSFNLIQVKRLITNDLYTPTTSAVDGNQIAVQAAALTITTLATPVGQSVVAGTNQVELANIQFNAQSGGEDVKISSITVTDTLQGGNTVYTGIANLTLWNGSTQITTTNSTAVNDSTLAFNFQSQLLVPRATPVTLVLKGDMLNVTSSTQHRFSLANNSAHITAVGKDTGNSLVAANLTISGSGQTMSVASAGTLSLSLVSGSGASPSTDQLVAVGTTNGTYFAFKMSSQVELQKITSLKITATSTGSTGLSSNTLQNIRLYEGSISTPFAQTAQMTCASGQCTYTWTATDNLLSAPVPTTGVTIYVKADIGAGGVADLGNSFKFMIASTGDVAVKGAVSATTTATVSGTPTASGVTYVVPFRVTVEGTSPTAATQVGTGAGQTLGVFKITNSGSAPIYLATSTSFSLANGGSATSGTSFNLYGSASGGSSADASLTFATSSTAGGATGASSTLPFNIANVSEANRTIPGGSWRYVTVKTSGASANNDTYQLSVSALGNLKFYVKESDMGWSGNPSSDTDVSDTIDGIYIEGIPSLATVTAKT